MRPKLSSSACIVFAAGPSAWDFALLFSNYTYHFGMKEILLLFFLSSSAQIPKAIRVLLKLEERYRERERERERRN